MNRRVRTIWSDLNGLTHGRYVPSSRIGHHTHHAVTTLVMSPEGEILPLAGYSADVGYQDLSAVPLPETRRPGWEPETDVVICDLLGADGQPLPICPRGALARAVDGWRAIGYEPQLGFELELYLLERADDVPGGWRPTGGESHLVYGVGLGGDPTGLSLEFFDIVESMGLGLEGLLSEFSPGQIEVNLAYGRALEAADRAVVAKEMTREVAARRGYRATYLGRPDALSVGSGLHVNFSIVPVSGGANALHDAAKPEELSTLARQSIGGLIAHHEAVAGLTAPLINSYKRLMPGLIAGYWANWGLDNRISTYRVPAERGAATRIENRMPCGTASPYLAAAVTLNAALLGVVDGADCGLPQLGDGDTAPNTERHSPHTLAEALDAVEADTVLAEAMGPELVTAYVALRRHECAQFEASGESWDPEQVTAWELDRYLRFY
ncbi:MAG: glutamine synthetase family protein [Actinomycetota bacterium]|nr:glutamine synthetase family protein [Actinomycetota bacterium]